MKTIIEEIIGCLRHKRLHLNDEKILQREIKAILSIELSHLLIVPEYRLDKENIIDFWINSTVGVEVKIKGGVNVIYIGNVSDIWVSIKSDHFS